MLTSEIENHITKLYENKNATPFQKEAFEAFSRVGLPTKKSEAFRYFPLRHLDKEKLLLSSADTAETTLPEKMIALPMKEAMRKYRPILERHLYRQLKEEKNPFTLLHHALSSDALFLYLPPHVKLKEPVILTKPAKLHLFLGKGAEVHFRFQNQESTLSYVDLYLDEGAKLSITTRFEESDTMRFESLRAYLEKGAKLTHLTLSKGAKVHRQDFVVDLMGEESEASLKGLALLKNKSENHLNLLINHRAPNAKSTQHYKAIVEDEARSLFEGKIYVESHAQKTEAYQLSNHLILGEKAQAMSKPGLEIYADDVKASHGATTTQIDETLRLYLEMRGLTRSEAEQLLRKAFAAEIWDQMSDGKETI